MIKRFLFENENSFFCFSLDISHLFLSKCFSSFFFLDSEIVVFWLAFFRSMLKSHLFKLWSWFELILNLILICLNMKRDNRRRFLSNDWSFLLNIMYHLMSKLFMLHNIKVYCHEICCLKYRQYRTFFFIYDNRKWR